MVAHSCDAARLDGSIATTMPTCHKANSWSIQVTQLAAGTVSRNTCGDFDAAVSATAL